MVDRAPLLSGMTVLATDCHYEQLEGGGPSNSKNDGLEFDKEAFD